MIFLPIIATSVFFIVIVSLREKIEESILDPKEHKSYAAMVSLGLTFAWFATAVDITAAVLHQNDLPGYLTDYSMSSSNDAILIYIIMSICFEIFFIVASELILAGGIVYRNCMRPLIHANDDGPVEFWTFMLILIPPIWCFFSRLGFIIVAWTSFVRHSASFTIFYIFLSTAAFSIMRETYGFIVNIWYKCKYNKCTEEEREEEMKSDGILIPALWIVRVVGFALVLVFIYLIFGLWLLPVPEVVEDAPMYLNDALQLILVVLAAIISYELYNIKKRE